jgi:hypothetical protein
MFLPPVNRAQASRLDKKSAVAWFGQIAPQAIDTPGKASSSVPVSGSAPECPSRMAPIGELAKDLRQVTMQLVLLTDDIIETTSGVFGAMRGLF